MAVASVDIQVDARSAVQQLKNVNQQSQQLQQTANGTAQALNRQQQALNTTKSAFSGLASGVARLAAAYVGLRTAQEAVQAGIQREESSRRLQFLAKGYNEIAAAQDAAARAGKQFGLSATESNQQFAQLYGRLRPLNVSIQDIETAFVGFNTAAKVSGSTAAESAGALLQLTQALGSGVLRGQELNSVLEQAPGLVVALTQELGAPISQIRKLAEEGKITSEVVIRALKRAATEGADELGEAMKGPAQQVKNLQNAFQDLQVAATEDLMPAITSSIVGLRDVLISLGPVVRGIGAIAASTLGTLADLVNMASKPGAFAARTSIRGGRLPLGTGGAAELFKGTSGAGGVGLTGIINEARELSKLRRQSYNQVLMQLMQNRLNRMEAVPAIATPSISPGLMGGAAGGGGGGKSKATSQAKEIKDITAQELELRLRLGMAQQTQNERQEAYYTKQLALLQIAQQEIGPNDRKAQTMDAVVKYATTLKEINEKEAKETLPTIIDRIADMAAGYSKGLDFSVQLTDQQKQQKALSDGIASTIGEGMTSAFNAVIQGSEDFGASLRRIASGVLIDIANQLLQVFVIQKAINAISGLFGGGGGGGGFAPGVKFNSSAFSMPSLLGRAKGGSVMAGQPYIVGERGPELFMPGKSGGIAPAGSFGSGVNVVVNVDASGSQVQGNQGQGKALGAVIAAAVQSELIKQKKPGGLLY